MVGAPILLTINNGSSSCKAALFTYSPEDLSGLEKVADVTIHHTGDSGVVHDVRRWLQEYEADYQLTAIGHRFVHGGMRYDRPQLITNDVSDHLTELETFDPLHAKPANELLRDFMHTYPDIPQVACFDTSFFTDMPNVAKHIALPDDMRDIGVRRYGFHGLSYAYLQREFERMAGTVAKNGRVIYAHLGSGSSLTATRNGRVIDTTMGFSPVSGIPSSTRSGDIDPTIVSFVEKRLGTSAADFTEIAQTKSGLLAISGTSGDMKHLISVESDSPQAAEAIELYVYHVQKAIGALAATIGGLDSLVFTGGIGEESDIIRNRVCTGLSFLGISLDHDKNSRHEFTISSSHSGSGVHVINANEAVIIAEQTRQIAEGVRT